MQKTVQLVQECFPVGWQFAENIFYYRVSAALDNVDLGLRQSQDSREA
jgi:hypothetical protein